MLENPTRFIEFQSDNRYLRSTVYNRQDTSGRSSDHDRRLKPGLEDLFRSHRSNSQLVGESAVDAPIDNMAIRIDSLVHVSPIPRTSGGQLLGDASDGGCNQLCDTADGDSELESTNLFCCNHPAAERDLVLTWTNQEKFYGAFVSICGSKKLNRPRVQLLAGMNHIQ